MEKDVTAPEWPQAADVESRYSIERADIDDLIANANDLGVWTLESRRENAVTYLHCKNNERLSYAVRAISTVKGTVTEVLDSLRSPNSSRYRHVMKSLHPKTYLDAEVLYHHSNSNNETNNASAFIDESISLKWLALHSGSRLGRSKEFLYRSYCVLYRKHPIYGDVGICRFVSYDGVGAKYGFRAKPDVYTLSVFEPSVYIVQPSNEKDFVRVTLTFALRKARGGETLSNGIKLLGLRLAHDTRNLQRTVHQSRFQSTTIARKEEWEQNGARNKCSKCQQTFSMLRRKHHCRVCGDLVCASCTTFQYIQGGKKDAQKVRACKICIPNAQSTQIDDASAGKEKPMLEAVDEGDRNRSDSISSTSSGEDDSFGRIDDSAITGNGGTHNHPSDHQPMNKYPNSSISSASTRTVTSEYGSCESESYFSPTSSDLKTSLREQRKASHTESLNEMGYQSHDEVSEAVSNRQKSGCRRINYFNEDLDQICMLAMEALNCPIVGVRTDDFELVRYHTGGVRQSLSLPRSLPTFRRMATRGKPCIVLNVSGDHRIAGDKRNAAKLQFFIGIPLLLNGDVVGDICVGDIHPRTEVDAKQLAVLNVLAETVTRYMRSQDFSEDLLLFRKDSSTSMPATNPSDSDIRSMSQFSIRDNSTCLSMPQPRKVKETAF